MPEVVGHYRVLERLGTGAIGELFRARDGRLGRTVALRVVSGEMAADLGGCARLIDAARAATVLSHPNIAALYEVGEADGQAFLAHEFVAGEPLARLVDGRPLSPRRAIGYAIQLADALAEAHAAGIEHGFLTTSTILITPKGHTKILDFGVAGWSRAARSLRPVSDLWSLGAVLFELLTGTSPLTQGPPPLSTPTLADPDLIRIIGRLRAGAAEGGYSSAATVAAELRGVAERLDERRAANPPDVGVRDTADGPSFRWLLIALALIIVAAVVWAASRLR